jgi:putative CocE/NonD family hydrolase
MRRALLALMVLALLCTGTVQAVATHEDTTSLHYVTVSDGEEIAVRVFLPPGHVEGERYPVLFTMEGYGGAGGHNDSTYNHRHAGYVLVAASLRGTGCSGGTLDLFDPRSSLDGAEIIEDWLPTQDWYDPAQGVGLFGHSYAGLTGFLVAAEQPEGLKAVAVSGLIDDFYRGILYPGGVPNPGFPILWGAGVRPALEHQANADELGSDPKCLANYAEHAGTHWANPVNLLDTYGHREATPDSWAIQRSLSRRACRSGSSSRPVATTPTIRTTRRRTGSTAGSATTATPTRRRAPGGRAVTCSTRTSGSSPTSSRWAAIAWRP